MKDERWGITVSEGWGMRNEGLSHRKTFLKTKQVVLVCQMIGFGNVNDRFWRPKQVVLQQWR